MGKALMVGGASTTALASGDEINLFGYNAKTTTEANTQVQATEGATFSNLGFRVISGGSGTNTLQFRDAGANGNQVVAFAGTGSGEDATNTDILTAADLFNLAYTDTGTDSTCAWQKCNVTFASGHGNFHGAANFGGVVYDVASETRYLPLGGGLTADGVTDENWVGFKIRGYTTMEAFQVRVTANARTNNSVFKNRINLGDGTGSITFATGETGLKVVTGLADAITAGQVVNCSLTLDTGVQDLTVCLTNGTFKSTTMKSELWAQSLGLARAASATPNYICVAGNIQSLTALTEANARIKVGFAATVSNLRCYLSANTYSVNGTLKLFKNGSAVLTTDITLLGGAGWYENTVDTVTINDTDELSFEFNGGTTGSITIRSVGATLRPPDVTGYGGLHHITCGIGDTGVAVVPQTLHTIEQGIAA